MQNTMYSIHPFPNSFHNKYIYQIGVKAHNRHCMISSDTVLPCKKKSLRILLEILRDALLFGSVRQARKCKEGIRSIGPWWSRSFIVFRSPSPNINGNFVVSGYLYIDPGLWNIRAILIHFSCGRFFDCVEKCHGGLVERVNMVGGVESTYRTLLFLS